MLKPVDMVCQEIQSEKGNVTKLYLLRAVAAWAWLQKDDYAHAANVLLQRYLPTLVELCESETTKDPAPLGSIIAYMALMGNTVANQQWFYIANKMFNDKCYFELAFFHDLLNQEQRAKTAFKKFKQQQYRVLQQMKHLKAGVAVDDYETLLATIEARLEREDENKVSNMRDMALRKGVIPF